MSVAWNSISVESSVLVEILWDILTFRCTSNIWIIDFYSIATHVKRVYVRFINRKVNLII